MLQFWLPDHNREQTLKHELMERARSLCAALTLEQKAAQLCNRSFMSVKDFVSADGTVDMAALGEQFPHGFGGIHIAFSVEPDAYVRVAEGLKAFNMQVCGIPPLCIAEGLHGFMAAGATVFPQALALGCTWDRDLVERVFRVTAAEARLRGVGQLLSPVLDLGREPRFGRVEEMFSEDAWLVAQLGKHAVWGIQGRHGEPGPRSCAATLKHFVGHGQIEGGRNCAPLNLGTYDLLNEHVLPFATCVRDGKVLSVMPSYNEFNGLPNHGNPWLLQDVLRGELGFDGLVTSDQNAVDEMYRGHAIVPDAPAAAALALANGIDVDVSWMNGTFVHIPDMVRAGSLDESLVDRALERLLYLKLLLGLFDAPALSVQAMQAGTNTPGARAIALEAAEKSLVLLENKKGILPLDPGKTGVLALIGPNAKGAHFGGYSAEPRLGGTDILDGLVAFAASPAGAATGLEVRYAEGCRISTQVGSFWQNGGTDPVAAQVDEALMAEAVELARGADHVLLVLGEHESFAREGWSEDHRGDRDSLELVGRQLELARRIHALGKPLVVLLINGRPLNLQWFKEHADALLEGWYLGQEGGHAVANILFGVAEPSGRLAFTLPKSAGELPAYYCRKPSRQRSYVNTDSAPVYPFGFGLTYTEFAYGTPRLVDVQRPAELDPLGKAELCRVVVPVRNTGRRRGTETVQLYVRDKLSRGVRPLMELRDFARVDLAAGEEGEVSFGITLEQLAFYTPGLEHVVEAGDFDLMVGPDSTRLQTLAFRL